MTDRPILFSNPMIRALLEGRKTQTRRTAGLADVNESPDAWKLHSVGPLGYMTKPSAKGKFGATFESRSIEPGALTVCPQRLPFVPGDRLWIKESWNAFAFSEDGESAWPTKTIPTAGEIAEIHDAAYRVDVQPVYLESQRAREWFANQKWRPSIHMPRWASRLTLIVTDVRVQRLREISEADARAEGCDDDPMYPELGTSVHAFRDLWDSLNAKRGFGWDANPWVCAVTFTVHRQNIDSLTTPSAPAPQST